jgi:hypothetical protein
MQSSIEVSHLRHAAGNYPGDLRFNFQHLFLGWAGNRWAVLLIPGLKERPRCESWP